MDYALQLLLPILLGIFVGQWLDAKTGFAPWFTLSGLILGLALGMGILYKRARYGSHPGLHKKDTDKDDDA